MAKIGDFEIGSHKIGQENMGSTGKRIVSQGYLLYEYLNDDDIYTLVGVIDSALGSHAINPETGIATDQEEADEFFKTGKVNFKVKTR